MTRALLTAKDGPVVILTIDRPTASNAINLEVATALRDAAKDAIADPGCAALVLVNEVVADSTVRDRTVELARTVANGPVPAVAETKRLLREGGTDPGVDFRGQLDEEARVIVETVASDDARRRIRAFLDGTAQPAARAAR